MCKQVVLTLFVVFLSCICSAQQAAITGRWETPDKDIIEFYPDGAFFSAKQISTSSEKDKINNNKIIARELRLTINKVFDGIVIDPKDNKTYHGQFTVNENGTELNLKVKWGFLSFKETWKRIN
ncbi:hypothetical protein A0256_17560 [Mucilaginibacter sp. PAMC 26640]|nr:hypothetical protein A0256_17560 [Mucilaginibacter sp. PAMC 26640]